MSLIWKNFTTPQKYTPMIEKMEQKVEDIIHLNSNEEIWLLEHEPVYTGGTSAQPSDLLNPKKLPVFNTGRGGQYTYHGPGQRVIYFMLNLKKIFYPNSPDLRKFITLLEEVVINTLHEIDIVGERRKGRVGIWVTHNNNEEKIAAIGIRVKKWISFHGIAINLCPDLNNYQGIIPCGIKEFGITSIDKLGKKITMNELDIKIKYNFYKVFKNYHENC